MSGGRRFSYLDVADRTWPVLTRLMGGHARIYRATRGRIGHRWPGVPPMLLLDHVGARSGVTRTAPLLYVEDGDDLVIVASKGGFERNPSWLYNLRAHPDATVQVGARKIPVRAREADAAERERLWPRAVAAYPPYADYQARTERRIPVMILTPRA